MSGYSYEFIKTELIMEKQKNVLWAFFASVKLAIFTFIILALTSIIGTLIPQNKPLPEYIQMFGEGLTRVFQQLNVFDMYHAWWFVGLLVLFCINIIVCSFDRLPNVWRIVVMDNLDTDPEQLRKKRPQHAFSSQSDVPGTAALTETVLKSAGWQASRADLEKGVLLFSQKGAWTRFGVYMVHTSILIIFIGAIIGVVYGQKGSVVIPEKRFTEQAYSFDGGQPIPLGFRVRLDRFTLEYYSNGAPKEYRSDLTVIENGQEVLKKSIEVNTPLDYKGFTFYQASYEEYDKFLITIQDQKTGLSREFLAPPGQEIPWQEAGLKFGIVNMMGPNRIGEYRLKIWLSDENGAPSSFWLDNRTTVSVERPGTVYDFTSKRYYATGLQVAKDPGVWWVYSGCILMLLGLVVTFFLSHKRIWVYISQEGDGAELLVVGSSNKNKVSFENNLEILADRFQDEKTLELKKD